MRERNRSFGRSVVRVALALVLAGALIFGLALGALCLAEANPPEVRQDSGAVIVLGCQVYADGRPSPQLELRLQAALDTYRAHPRLIIAAGGQGGNEPGPEGEIMRAWLIGQGVPETDVIAETASVNTRQNLLNAKAMLPDTVARVTVITSDYHLPRALALARDAGLDTDGIGSPCRPEIGFWVQNHTREVLAWGKYLVQKAVGSQ